jgi:hypothetical protein
MEAERGHIKQDEWALVSAYLKHATQYCLSPLTVGELLSALVNGSPRYFRQHQRRLRVLLSPGDQPEVFDFVPYFVAQQLGLNIERPARLEDNFLESINLILEAPSKDALLQGFSHHGKTSKQTMKIRIDRFAEEHAALMEKYIEYMTFRREHNEFQIPRDVWASGFLKFYKVSGNVIALDEVAERLSANYEFEMFVCNLLRDEQYSISKHKSDLIDMQQLCYLCDPNVVFITKDSGFRKRIQNSPQASRITTFADLLACANNKLPLL